MRNRRPAHEKSAAEIYAQHTVPIFVRQAVRVIEF